MVISRAANAPKTSSNQPSRSSTPPAGSSQTKQHDAFAANWRLIATTVDRKESFWVDLDSITTDQGLVSFWLRENLAAPRTVAGITYASSIARYSTNCTSQKLTSTTTTFYDASGKVVNSGASTSTLDVGPGMISKGVYEAVCAYARGGDLFRSRVFPKGLKDDGVELQPVTGATLKDYEVFLDVKSVYRDSSKPFAMAKLVGHRIVQPEPATAQTDQLLFMSVVFGCTTYTADTLATEMFDSFFRLTDSDYKSVEQVTDKPVIPGSMFQVVLTKVCATHTATDKGATASASKDGRAEPIDTGTGWYADVGYVVTAYHVIQGKKNILLYGVDRKPVSASVVAADPANDIALLDGAFQAKPSVGLSVAKSPATLGSRVFTIGFPHPDLLGLSPKFTAGEVSAIAGIGDDPRVLQISVPVQAGNSGGPLINSAGEVVGIVSGKLSADKVLKATGDLTQNINYAVKARYLQGMLDDLGSRQPRAARPKPGPISDIVEQRSDLPHRCGIDGLSVATTPDGRSAG